MNESEANEGVVLRIVEKEITPLIFKMRGVSIFFRKETFFGKGSDSFQTDSRKSPSNFPLLGPDFD